MSAAPHYDIFCTVIDNYGDIGVCWRLARQLTAERGRQVRLWVDDLQSCARLLPELAPNRTQQYCRGVELRHWRTPFPEVTPAAVVIEAFACELPDSFVAAMAEQAKQGKAPHWINLEYLSAEDWVTGCHGLPSPHPRLPLLKHFFFPGFVPDTGGLLLEQGLPAQRAAFQADLSAQADFWQSLNLPPPQRDELRLSLFAYDNPQTLTLLEHWANGEQLITCLVPEATPTARLLHQTWGLPLVPGNRLQRGRLQIVILPFLEQNDYDRLLWACDLNFVRGEDSFVRAQWAARPFIWQIYPQEENAHHIKLTAFLARYRSGLPPESGAALETLWQVWNGMNTQLSMAEAWTIGLPHRPALLQHGPLWASRLADQGDLVAKLENFLSVKL